MQHLNWVFALFNKQLIVDCFRDAGALGSRLTGAGWGGCAVSLVPSTEVDHFMEALKTSYYQDVADTSTVLFATKPGDGACVYEV